MTDDTDKKTEKRDGKRILAGSLVILAGVGFLLQKLYPWFNFGYVWPVMVIAVGVYMVVRGTR